MTQVDLTSTEEVRFPRSQSGSEPQHLLSILLGDYWFSRTEHISSTGLVALLRAFDITESSARQAMLRLHKRGVLERSRNGRTTSYGFRPRSDTVTALRLKHVVGFGTTPPPWDGRWTIVTLTVPDRARPVRLTVQNRLRGLGFALLQDGVWLSPRDRVEAAGRVLAEHKVRNGHTFRAEHLAHSAVETALERSFDLGRLRRHYERFITAHRPALDDVDGIPDPLLYRTRMMNQWLAFRGVDPELPAELWPADWPRPEARRIFRILYDELGPRAEAQFKSLLSESDPDLVQHTGHHLAGQFDDDSEHPASPALA